MVDTQFQVRKPRMVALFSERSDEVVQYLKARNLNVDFVAEVNFQPLQISGTPTMVLVNEKGAVKDFWIGKIQDANVDRFFEDLVAAGMYVFKSRRVGL